MAVNQERDMSSEFHQGIEENSYMQLTPNRGCVEHPPVERLDWPTYQQVLRHRHDPMADHRPAVHEIHTKGTNTTNRRT